MRHSRPAPTVIVDLGATFRPLLAVSGGPDSIALLLLMHAQKPGTFFVATFDHGLRPESADEAAFVGEVCASRHIGHAILHPTVPINERAPEAPVWTTVSPAPTSTRGGLRLPEQSQPQSLQARARTARYDALAAHALALGCDAIVTAHHRDDQAETLLMRASRGSGVDGLAGVRTKMAWNGFPVLRPLLGVSRSDLRKIVNHGQIRPVEDPSNVDPAYDRARFRRIIDENADIRSEGLARSAAALAEASEALEWMADRLAADRIARSDVRVTLDPRDLPRELRRRLLTTALRRLGASAPRGPSIDRVLVTLESGGKGSLGDLLVEAATDGIWSLYPAPPRRSH